MNSCTVSIQKGKKSEETKYKEKLNISTSLIQTSSKLINSIDSFYFINSYVKNIMNKTLTLE